MTYREWMALGTERLQAAGIEEAPLDAWYLLERASGISRSRYYLVQKDPFPEEAAEKFQKLLAERARRVPLQQILGDTEFMGLTFLVNEHVLTPRQDTELLVELALKNLQRRTSPARVLDMCTGSGCIAVSLACLGKPASVTAADLSEEALQVAKQNAEKNQAAVHFIKSDLFQALVGETYDVIVSNPPYIPSDVIPGLMPEVRDHEPHMALDGGADGLEFYRILAQEGRAYLAEGGSVFYEIGYDQGEAVSRILEACGYHEIALHKDLNGLDRVVSAEK